MRETRSYESARGVRSNTYPYRDSLGLSPVAQTSRIRRKLDDLIVSGQLTNEYSLHRRNHARLRKILLEQGLSDKQRQSS